MFNIIVGYVFFVLCANVDIQGSWFSLFLWLCLCGERELNAPPWGLMCIPFPQHWRETWSPDFIGCGPDPAYSITFPESD